MSIEKHSSDLFYPVFLLLFIVFAFSSCCKDEEILLTLSTDKIEVPAEGEKTILAISSNSSWEVSVSEPWVKPSVSSGKGDAELTLTISAHTGNEDRSMVLTITSKDEVRHVKILQYASYLTLSTYELVFDEEGTPLQVTVTSNYQWTVNKTETAAWCDLDVAGGEGDRVVTLTPTPYTERVRRGTDYIVFSCFNVTTKLAISQKITNEPPVATELLLPQDNESEVEIPVSFSWEPSIDPDGDEVNYTLYISSDKSNWQSVTNGTTDTSCRVGIDFLKEYSRYYWKVVAHDDFGGEVESGVYSFTTGTSNYYKDGEVTTCQYYSSLATNPVHLVVVGDGFVAEDYEFGGTFDKAAEKAIEAFFSVEPYPTYKDYFTVYKVSAYSKERGATVKSDFINSSQKKQTRNTIFNCELEGGNSTEIDCNDRKVFEYVKKIPAITDSELSRTTVILIINMEVYAGTAIMWEDGASITMCPMGDTFEEIVYHEAGGHGFGRLLDEYIYYPTEKITDKQVQNIIKFRNGDAWDFGANLSLTNNKEEIHWKHYFDKPQYSDVGIHQGGYFYGIGIWRPEVNSCMNNNVPYFNAPSREAIVRRIMKISGKEFDDADFYSKDLIRSYSSAVGQSAATRSTFRTPLAPPVLKSGSVK